MSNNFGNYPQSWWWQPQTTIHEPNFTTPAINVKSDDQATILRTQGLERPHSSNTPINDGDSYEQANHVALQHMTTTAFNDILWDPESSLNSPNILGLVPVHIDSGHEETTFSFRHSPFLAHHQLTTDIVPGTPQLPATAQQGP